MTTANDSLAQPARRHVRDLPGPKGVHAFQLPSEQIHLQVEQWAKEYGEIFKFRIGGRQFVALSNADQVASVLRDRPEGFQRTDRLNSTAREAGFNGLFSANGEAWKRQRPMVLAGLDPTHIKAFHPDPSEGHAAPRRALAKGCRTRRCDRPSGRLDALHRGCHGRAGVWNRHQHD